MTFLDFAQKMVFGTSISMSITIALRRAFGVLFHEISLGGFLLLYQKASAAKLLGESFKLGSPEPQFRIAVWCG